MFSMFLTLVKLILICLAFALTTACGPVMKNVNEYIPPVTDSGMRCVAEANQERAQCDGIKHQKIIDCTQKADIVVNERYQEAQSQYTKALEIYIREKDIFDIEKNAYDEKKRLIIRDGELEYIQCSKDVELKNINENPQCEKFLTLAHKKAKKLIGPRTPQRPQAPQIDDMHSRYIEQCHNIRSNCESVFNQSYQSCGGKIIQREICIKNCK